MAHARLSSRTAGPLQIVSRMGAALGGGYVFTYGACALGIVLLVRAGMGFEQAEKLVYLLAFLLFLGLFCGAFAARRLLRLWLLLLGGGAATTAAAWWLARPMA